MGIEIATFSKEKLQCERLIYYSLNDLMFLGYFLAYRIFFFCVSDFQCNIFVRGDALRKCTGIIF